MLALLAALAPAAAQELTAEQQRGRAIYVEGKSSTGQPIMALVGAGRNALPASLFACASCHGEDGRGRREGGISPADITPAALGRAAVVGVRTRQSYTAALLKRAVATGRDSGGQLLDRAMPRYRMSERDANDLLAYLAILDSVAPPGVSADAVRVNVIGAPRLAAPAQTIYGRRIGLQHGGGRDAFMTIDASPDGSASVRLAERERIPTIVVSPGRARPGAHTVVIAASKDDQVAALRDYASSRAADSMLLTEDCRGLQAWSGAALVLMTADAAELCDLDSIPAGLDRKIIVAAPAPPNADLVAQAQLAIVAMTLERLGRNFTRKTFLDALERSYRLAIPGLPPVTWSRSRRYGSSQVWLMTLDLSRQALLADPGWWAVPEAVR